MQHTSRSNCGWGRLLVLDGLDVELKKTNPLLLVGGVLVSKDVDSLNASLLGLDREHELTVLQCITRTHRHPQDNLGCCLLVLGQLPEWIIGNLGLSIKLNNSFEVVKHSLTT